MFAVEYNAAVKGRFRSASIVYAVLCRCMGRNKQNKLYHLVPQISNWKITGNTPSFFFTEQSIKSDCSTIANANLFYFFYTQWILHP